MTVMTCAQLAEAAPELALGVLSGRERADALGHLDGCSSCRHLVTSLSGATDELLRTFAPSIEPPAGFEARVLAALTPPRPRDASSARRHRTVAALAVAACLAFLVGALLTLDASPKPALAAAEMKTDSGEVVGWILVDRGEPAVYMTLPRWAQQTQRYGREGATYSLQLTSRTGTHRVLPVSLDSLAGWKATLDLDPGAFTSAELIDGSGHVWCHADLGNA